MSCSCGKELGSTSYIINYGKVLKPDDEAARLSLPNLKEGYVIIQQDTGLWYLYDGTDQLPFPAGGPGGGLTTGQVQALIAEMFNVSHTGIDVDYDGTVNKFTLTVTGGGGSLDQEAVEDFVAGVLNAGVHQVVTVNYDDAGNAISLSVDLSSIEADVLANTTDVANLQLEQATQAMQIQDAQDDADQAVAVAIANLATLTSLSPIVTANQSALGTPDALMQPLTVLYTESAKGDRDDVLLINHGDSLHDGKRIGYSLANQIAHWRAAFYDAAYSNLSWFNVIDPGYAKYNTEGLGRILQVCADHHTLHGTTDGDGIIWRIAGFGNNNSQYLDTASYAAALINGINTVKATYPYITIILVEMPASGNIANEIMINDAYSQVSISEGYALVDCNAMTQEIYDGVGSNNFYTDAIHFYTTGAHRVFNYELSLIQDAFLMAKMPLYDMPEDPAVTDPKNLVETVGAVAGQGADVRGMQLIEVPLGGYRFTVSSLGNDQRTISYDKDMVHVINRGVNPTQGGFVDFDDHPEIKFIRFIFADNGATYDALNDVPVVAFHVYPSVTKILSQDEINVYADIRNPNRECHCETVSVSPVPETSPDAPSGLTISEITETSMRLTWVDNASNEEGFDIEQSLDGSTGWTVINTSSIDALTYVVTGLTGSTDYHFRVKANHATLGDSAYSNIATDTTSASAGGSVIIPGSVANPWTGIAGTGDPYEDGGAKQMWGEGFIYPSFGTGFNKPAAGPTMLAGQAFVMRFENRMHDDDYPVNGDTSGTEDTPFDVTIITSTIELSENPSSTLLAGDYGYYNNQDEIGFIEGGFQNYDAGGNSGTDIMWIQKIPLGGGLCDIIWKQGGTTIDNATTVRTASGVPDTDLTLHTNFVDTGMKNIQFDLS